MIHKVKIALGILLLLFIVHPVFGNENPRSIYRLSGVIVDASNSEPISFASVYIHKTSTSITADANGKFSVNLRTLGNYRATISHLGYQRIDTLIPINGDKELRIALQPQSFALDEVVVSAKESSRSNSTSVIEKVALEHIQPSSLTDVMQLLPGHLTKDVKLSEANLISMRQAGTDDNTSLGTAFLIDGAPVSNEANLQTVYGATASTDAMGKLNTESKGIDMRSISTDRIEKIEIVRGIPSVEHGDLTSGVVKIEMKTGRTPWEGRAKVDLTNKLFSLGKGFILPGNGGALNVDMDYLNYHPDPRNSLTSYKRATFSTRYQNKFTISDKTSFLLRANVNYTGSFDNNKKDTELVTAIESFESNYNKVSFGTSGVLQKQNSFLSEINYNLSGAYTKDELKRTRVVVPGAMPLSSSKEEGEFYASYLPATYITNLKVDGQPFNLSARVQAKANPIIGKLSQRLMLGSEWRYDVNLGKGEIYDLNLPPYPGSRSTRPRPYNDVPALQKLSVYAEDVLNLQLGKWRMYAQLGTRGTTLLNLSSKYDMSGKWYFESRINARLSFPKFTLFKWKSVISVGGGFGQHYKFPTQAQLYPNTMYYDYLQLNYYSQQESLRALNVRTWIEDPTNYGLKPALNNKYEVNFRMEVGDMSIDITLFDEKMNNGFYSVNNVVSHTYKDYIEDAVPPSSITEAPKVEDFPFIMDTLSAVYTTTKNQAKVYKKGIEYQLNLGRIPYLYTNVRLSGAWFITNYRNEGLRYRKPTTIVNDRPYLYVGVYDWDDYNKEKQQLNLNLYFDTHIPMLRMIFTTSIQTMWFQKTTYDWNSGLPIGYIDDAGRYYVFTAENAVNPSMNQLITTYQPNYFNVETVPFVATLTFKLTKEIGSMLSLSFYVNQLLSYAPDYKHRYGSTIVRKSNSEYQPSFGAELNIKF